MLTYTIGDPSLVIQFSDFSNSVYCGPITYTKVLSGNTVGDSMAVFSATDKTFTISSSDYTISSFTLTIAVNGAIFDNVSKTISESI